MKIPSAQNMLSKQKTICVHNMFYPCSPHVLSLEFSCTELNSMNNLSSYCGLVDAKIRASDKDLPAIMCWNSASFGYGNVQLAESQLILMKRTL